jgi:hypothetical protein
MTAPPFESVPPYPFCWSAAQRHFSRLMESDAIVRPLLLAQLREQEPECAAAVDAMFQAYESPEDEA